MTPVSVPPPPSSLPPFLAHALSLTHTLSLTLSRTSTWACWIITCTPRRLQFITTPYTVHPATLHSTPYTLHPTHHRCQEDMTHARQSRPDSSLHDSPPSVHDNLSLSREYGTRKTVKAIFKMMAHVRHMAHIRKTVKARFRMMAHVRNMTHTRKTVKVSF